MQASQITEHIKGTGICAADCGWWDRGESYLYVWGGIIVVAAITLLIILVRRRRAGRR
jgi:hypothetical protein